jgi:hypothetical protein
MCAGNERRGSAVRKSWRCVYEHIVRFDLLDNTTLLVPQGSSPPPTRLLADYPPTSLDVRVAYAVLEAKGEAVYVPGGVELASRELWWEVWVMIGLGRSRSRTGWVFSMYVETCLAGSRRVHFQQKILEKASYRYILPKSSSDATGRVP